MKGFVCLGLLACGGVTSILASSQAPAATPQRDVPSHESRTTIEGLVRDIACPIQNLDATATHFSMKCLVACAKKGSPLVILTKDGDLYLPISDTMPDRDQRRKLMPYLGKYVRATGTVYDRRGTHAIAITELRELKGEPLTNVDQ